MTNRNLLVIFSLLIIAIERSQSAADCVKSDCRMNQRNVHNLNRLLQTNASLTTMNLSSVANSNGMSSAVDDQNNEIDTTSVNKESIDRAKLFKPLHEHGAYDNPWNRFPNFSIKNVMQFAMSKSHSHIPSSVKLDSTLPVLKPNVKNESPADAMRITWIGHASTLVQFEDVCMLTDPVFSDRASMTQYFGPKRYRPSALRVDQLPETLNAVVISHNHYDHLDLNTVKALQKRFGDRIRWFVGQGQRSWFESLGIRNLQEMSWWDEAELFDGSKTKIAFLPAQHWSKRTLTDTNRSLWGGYAVIGQRFRFYFAGDTGYDAQVFKQIGQVYGPFDLAAIPIGAYEPNWFLKYQHVNPAEAVEIHQDVRSRYSVGIHWGTFDLSREDYLEPAKKVKETLESKQLPVDSFATFKHGESRLVYSDGTTKQDL